MSDPQGSSAGGFGPRVHRGATFTDIGLGALRRFPSRKAFAWDGGEATYRHVEARASQFAQALARRGFGPGHGVVMLTGNVPEYFYVLLAATALGGRITALHPLGSVDDHAYVVGNAEAKVFLYNPALYDDVGGAVAAKLDPSVDILALGPSDHAGNLLALADREGESTLRSVAEEDDLIALAYSSGTTGKPKGVIQRHRSTVEMTSLSMPGWQLPTSDFRFLAVTPISHASQAFVLPAWLHGGTVFLEKGFDPERFLRRIQDERITCTFVVPTVLYVLLDHEARGRFDTSSLECLVYGASPMSPPRLARAIDAFGQIFVQLYGQAEAPACVTSLRKEEHDPKNPELLASCGQPFPWLQVELHDDDDNEVPVGEIGEICVRGRLVADGYWKLPEQTAETWKNDWLHTGDMARKDEAGYLYIVDRKKDMIISGGMNVFAREVEDVLTSHPAVAAAAVIGIPDERWGEAIKGIVVVRAGTSVDADELIAHVKSRKGPIHAPKSIDFVEEIPLTPIAKPDKKALRAKYWGDQARGVS